MTLADPWPEHVEQIKTRGLRLSGSCGEHVVPVPALHPAELGQVREPFEAVFVAVKSYDTEWATQLAVDYLRHPDGVVVDFQNGINDHRVAAVAGRERTLGCVILISAGMYEPAHAIRTDRGNAAFKIGEHDGRDSPRARARRRDHERGRARGGHHQPVGRALVEARAQLHAEPARGPERAGHRRGALGADVRGGVAAHSAPRWSGSGPRAGTEIEPILGIAAKRFADAAEGRGPTRDARPRSRRTPRAGAAAGRRCCRT